MYFLSIGPKDTVKWNRERRRKWPTFKEFHWTRFTFYSLYFNKYRSLFLPICYFLQLSWLKVCGASWHCFSSISQFSSNVLALAGCVWVDVNMRVYVQHKMGLYKFQCQKTIFLDVVYTFNGVYKLVTQCKCKRKKTTTGNCFFFRKNNL